MGFPYGVIASVLGGIAILFELTARALHKGFCSGVLNSNLIVLIFAYNAGRVLPVLALILAILGMFIAIAGLFSRRLIWLKLIGIAVCAVAAVMWWLWLPILSVWKQ